MTAGQEAKEMGAAYMALAAAPKKRGRPKKIVEEPADKSPQLVGRKRKGRGFTDCDPAHPKAKGWVLRLWVGGTDGWAETTLTSHSDALAAYQNEITEIA